MNDGLIILGGEILTPEKVISGGYLRIEGERLVEVGEEIGDLPAGCRAFDATSYTVTPGLIDLHLHGAMGHNVMGAGLEAVIEELPRRGVTAFLPTTLTAGPSVVRAALAEMAEIILHAPLGAAPLGAAPLGAAPSGARPLGIHLEGPHLSPQKAGMAIARYFRPLTAEEWEDLQAAARGTIKMVTFAPEEGDGMRLIPRLIEEGVVPTIGHSNATFEQVARMVELGLAHATHVFNAMRPFHHRAPGVVGAVLYHREITAQLIADLHHVHPAAMELLFRLKGINRVALVSDAAPVSGLPPGEYDWDSETRVVVGTDGTCRLPDGTLAGATSFIGENVVNLVHAVGLRWTEAVQTATAVPGEVLGVNRGRLRPGWMADIAIWDHEFQPVATMVEGRWVWQRDGHMSLGAVPVPKG